MSQPISVGINKLSLQKGDVVVVSLPYSLPSVVFEEFRESLAKVFCGNTVVVLPPGHKLSLVRDGQPVEPEVDPAIEVTIP